MFSTTLSLSLSLTLLFACLSYSASDNEWWFIIPTPPPPQRRQPMKNASPRTSRPIAFRKAPSPFVL
uniref:Putative secreted protein n=1 Tax=Anopheles darlingi TaxID=43151 RepID=A0A2M4DE53_ANODA